MLPEIIKGNSKIEYETTERCLITEISNDPNDADVSISLAKVKPKTTTAWHKLTKTNERYIIISGEGKMEIGGIIIKNVSTGDIVRIPADIPQRITNISEVDLIFYCVCSPRFMESCYVALEK